jgi:hypothetical protein
VRSLRNDASVQSYELAGKDEIMYYDVETPMRWSITTGKKRKDCTGRFGNVLGFQADHSRVVLREGASLRVRSVSDCQEQVFYADGDETVATVDDKRLVVAAGGRITVWDLAKHEPVAILHALRDGLWSARTASHYTPPTHLAMPPSSTPATE